MPKEQDAGMEGIAGERRRSKTRRGQLTLPLRELAHEVLFDTVIVSGLEGEWPLMGVFIGLRYCDPSIPTQGYRRANGTVSA